MLRSASLLIRTSLPSVLVLTASLVVISNILADDPDDAGVIDAMPSFAPIVRKPPGNGAGAAIGQIAIFDPGRRPETIAGSIDDLRSGGGASAAPAPVTIAGIMFSGGERKAMLALGGGAPAWRSVGAEIGGWRVAAVDDAGAVLEREGQSLALKVADRYKLRKPETAPARPQSPPGLPAGLPPATESPVESMPDIP